MITQAEWITLALASIGLAVLFTKAMAALAMKMKPRKKDKRTKLKLPPLGERPRYVVWGRKDTAKRIGRWEIVAAGDDWNETTELARKDFPPDAFDLVTLENGVQPE